MCVFVVRGFGKDNFILNLYKRKQQNTQTKKKEKKLNFDEAIFFYNVAG